MSNKNNRLGKTVILCLKYAKAMVQTQFEINWMDNNLLIFNTFKLLFCLPVLLQNSRQKLSSLTVFLSLRNGTVNMWWTPSSTFYSQNTK